MFDAALFINPLHPIIIKIAIMNSFTTRKPFDINRLFFSLLNKIMQRPDFYPIKYYHKKRRGKEDLESL